MTWAAYYRNRAPLARSWADAARYAIAASTCGSLPAPTSLMEVCA